MDNSSNTAKNDFVVNKEGRTTFYHENFVYTWVIEGYDRCQNETHGLDIVSSVIVAKHYKFQLVVNPKKRSTNGTNYFYIFIKVLSCPINDTTIRVRRCIVKADDKTDYKPFESVLTIKMNEVLESYSLAPSEPYTCLSADNNLTIKYTFTFRHSVPCNIREDIDEVTALSKTILNDYEELLNSAKFSDVALMVGGKKFPVHKNILSARSPVFAAMFAHDMLEQKKNVVEITDVEPEIMAEVLGFIYANRVNNVEEMTAGLFAAADKYELEALRSMCENAFLDKISLENLIMLLKIVDQYDTCPRLHKAVLEFLSLNGNEVARWEKFDQVMKTLSPALLIEVTRATMLKC